MLEPHTPFPAFSLPDQDGTPRSAKNYAGKWLAVYFYPRDNTSGCSNEATDFATLHGDFTAKKAAVIGVSADSVKSHKNFAMKLNLPFRLLSDPDHVLLEACGVWRKKKMAGREYMGIVRSTFLVDPEGVIRAVWPKVSVAGHAHDVLATLTDIQTGARWGSAR